MRAGGWVVALLPLTGGLVQAQEPLPRAERLLGMAITEAEEGGFEAALSAAQAAGIELTSLSLNWDEVETAPGVFASEPDWLGIANAYYPTVPLKIHLVLRPVDTNGLHLPADLAGKALDDPQVIERFLAFVDHALGKLPDVDLTLVSLGNEVELGLLREPLTRWGELSRLYARGVERVHAQRPGVPVGIVATLDGLLGPQRVELQVLNKPSDAIVLTHYSLKGDAVLPPAELGPSLDKLLRAYPERPIVLAELGYPSSPELGSSEEQQAEFVREAFRCWDARADRIPQLSFCWQTEAPREGLQVFSEYYESDSPAFLAFLGSIGLRRREGAGSDKPAWTALRAEALARGWAR